jgi:protein-S-isoprenylcysteine O-methyltransferase Ste14
MKQIAKKDLIFVGIQAILLLIYFIPINPIEFHLNYILRIANLSLSIIGLIIMLFAFLQLNKNLTPFPTPIESGTLIQAGLYKYIRHPIYTGIIIFSIFFGIFNESIWNISIGVALYILFYFKSKYEETLLRNQYKDYDNYIKKTGRFFPFF